VVVGALDRQSVQRIAGRVAVAQLASGGQCRAGVPSGFGRLSQGPGHDGPQRAEPSLPDGGDVGPALRGREDGGSVIMTAEPLQRVDAQPGRPPVAVGDSGYGSGLLGKLHGLLVAAKDKRGFLELVR
jgi:hypothetical protein